MRKLVVLFLGCHFFSLVALPDSEVLGHLGNVIEQPNDDEHINDSEDGGLVKPHSEMIFDVDSDHDTNGNFGNVKPESEISPSVVVAPSVVHTVEPVFVDPAVEQSSVSVNEAIIASDGANAASLNDQDHQEDDNDDEFYDAQETQEGDGGSDVGDEYYDADTGQYDTQDSSAQDEKIDHASSGQPEETVVELQQGTILQNIKQFFQKLIESFLNLFRAQKSEKGEIGALNVELKEKEAALNDVKEKTGETDKALEDQIQTLRVKIAALNAKLVARFESLVKQLEGQDENASIILKERIDACNNDITLKQMMSEAVDLIENDSGDEASDAQLLESKINQMADQIRIVSLRILTRQIKERESNYVQQQKAIARLFSADTRESLTESELSQRVSLCVNCHRTCIELAEAYQSFMRLSFQGTYDSTIFSARLKMTAVNDYQTGTLRHYVVDLINHSEALHVIYPQLPVASNQMESMMNDADDAYDSMMKFLGHYSSTEIALNLTQNPSLISPFFGVQLQRTLRAMVGKS